MLASLVTLVSWATALLLVVITVMLAMNKQSGLKMIQHRVEMLPQALLVRYAGLSVLALIASLLSAPTVAFSMLLAMAVIGFGDAYIYRRAGHPFWLHVAVGGLALFGALLSLIAMN